LQTGDLLHLRFRARRLDLIDPLAFRDGVVDDNIGALLGGREDLARERMGRLKARQRRVAATNWMTNCTDASLGVVPQVVWDECETDFWSRASVAGVA
jgi:hypothetical protein